MREEVGSSSDSDGMRLAPPQAEGGETPTETQGNIHIQGDGHSLWLGSTSMQSFQL